jgi:hypothetical protein
MSSAISTTPPPQLHCKEAALARMSSTVSAGADDPAEVFDITELEEDVREAAGVETRLVA